MTLDSATAAPTLSSRANNASFGASDTLTVTYTLPETPHPGSVRLIFRHTNPDPDEDYTLVMATSTSVNFSLNLKDLSSAAGNLISATGPNGAISAIPDGTYQVILQYQDSLQNPAASVSVTITASFTPPPTVSLPATGQFYSKIPIQFSLPDPNGIESGSITLTLRSKLMGIELSIFGFSSTSPQKQEVFGSHLFPGHLRLIWS